MSQLLNIGCGTVLDPRWENIDLVACAPGVRAHDILSGLPYRDATIDAVYSSHVLEHLTPAQAEALLREARRVLRPGGVIRIAVPDLEGIARAYLREVDALRAGKGNPHRHRWLLVELIDQMVRTRSGGSYGSLIRDFPTEELPFAEARLGRAILEAYRRPPAEPPAAPASPLRRLKLAFKNLLGHRLGVDLDQARFRASGEVHQWMYDEFNLRALLERCGFAAAEATDADRSRIPGWTGYHLDRDPSGTVRKPDSLFMEASKPAA